jgi:hypothetical protein
MKNAHLLLFLPVLLAACADPVSGRATATPQPLAVYIARATQDVSAEQTQRADIATATSNAIIFRAQQTELAHQAIVTATQDAHALQMTANAITGTAEALKATQIALDKMSAKSTIEFSVWPTLAYATSEALVATVEQNRTTTGTLGSLSLIVIGLFVVVALIAASWIGVSVFIWLSAIVEKHRHECEMNRAVEDHEAAINAKLWDEVSTDVKTDDTDEAIHRQMWLTRLGIFFAAGDRLGFSNRAMCPDVLSNRAWGPLVQHLIGCKVLEQDQTGTRWAGGYDLAHATAELRSEALPYPAWTPPDVKWGGNAIRENTLITAITPTKGITYVEQN